MQVVLLAIAVAGLVVLVRRRRYAEAALLALPLLYVTGVHVPLLCRNASIAAGEAAGDRAGGDRDYVRHFPANRSFMNSSISDTQTRPSAPFCSM